jgi:hypothetical protein
MLKRAEIVKANLWRCVDAVYKHISPKLETSDRGIFLL